MKLGLTGIEGGQVGQGVSKEGRREKGDGCGWQGLKEGEVDTGAGRKGRRATSDRQAWQGAKERSRKGGGPYTYRVNITVNSIR